MATLPPCASACLRRPCGCWTARDGASYYCVDIGQNRDWIRRPSALLSHPLPGLSSSHRKVCC